MPRAQPASTLVIVDLWMDCSWPIDVGGCKSAKLRSSARWPHLPSLIQPPHGRSCHFSADRPGKRHFSRLGTYVKYIPFPVLACSCCTGWRLQRSILCIGDRSDSARRESQGQIAPSGHHRDGGPRCRPCHARSSARGAVLGGDYARLPPDAPERPTRRVPPHAGQGHWHADNVRRTQHLLQAPAFWR